MLKKSIQNEAPIIENFKGSKRLIVSFGGVKLGIGMPVFEFMKVLNVLNCDQLFIRDVYQSWYHRGISVEHSNIDSLAEMIKQKIEPYEEVCFIGNSMGGYAAILFGTLLKVEKVIAFSPQSFIGKFLRFKHGDRRWKKEIESIYGYKKRVRKKYDLKKALKSHESYDTHIEIHYSNTDRLDKLHSERLKSSHQVQLNGYDFGGHRLVKELKTRGTLDKIVATIFKN